jgi:hypothetical protein
MSGESSSAFDLGVCIDLSWLLRLMDRPSISLAAVITPPHHILKQGIQVTGTHYTNLAVTAAQTSCPDS